MVETLKKWQLALAGVTAAAIAWGNAVSAQFDSDVLTVPDWNLAFTATFLAIGLFQGRPNNVTSEEAGLLKQKR